MGWMFCGDFNGRPIGYGVAATCDQPGCTEEIDRGLSYVCGGMHHGGEHGCGGYFCGEHLRAFESLCEVCAARMPDEDEDEDDDVAKPAATAPSPSTLVVYATAPRRESATSTSLTARGSKQGT